MALRTGPFSRTSSRSDSGLEAVAQSGGEEPDAVVDPLPGIEGRVSAGPPWGQRFASWLYLTDGVALIWAAVGVHLVHPQGVTSRSSTGSAYLPFLALTVALLILWMFALGWSGSRDAKTIGYGALEYKRVINATIALFGLVAILSYLFQLNLPRSYLLIMMPADLLAILATRYVWRRWLHAQRD